MRKLHELYAHAVFRQIVVVMIPVNSVLVFDAVPRVTGGIRVGGSGALETRVLAKRPPAFPQVSAHRRMNPVSGSVPVVFSEISAQRIFDRGGACKRLSSMAG